MHSLNKVNLNQKYKFKNYWNIKNSYIKVRTDLPPSREPMEAINDTLNKNTADDHRLLRLIGQQLIAYKNLEMDQLSSLNVTGPIITLSFSNLI